MKLLVTNIARIVGLRPADTERVCGAAMAELPELENAWLLAVDGRIAAYGPMTEPCTEPADRTVDAEGGMLFPSFCDSHTHLVYAGSREQEFLDKINGLSYEEIAKRGGGILNSADRLHETSEDELYAQAMERVREIVAMGTGCVEIKSGYGLTTEDELKMLRVIRRIRETAPLEVRATFLGAHAVARGYIGRQSEYVDMVCREMIPAVAAENLADFVDVFCDKGFFTVEETERIMRCGAEYGMRAKIHANELDISGGVEAGVRHGALSVDHLERMGDEQIESKAVTKSITMAQKRVEGFNFDTRKTLLDYDDVLRRQREIIYAQRNKILESEEVHDLVKVILEKAIDQAMQANLSNEKKQSVDAAGLAKSLEMMGLQDDKAIHAEELEGKSFDEIRDYLYDKVWNGYENEIKDVRSQFLPFEKTVVLRNIDRNWIEHIDRMDKLRSGIYLRSYAQNNPLQQYVQEGFDMFEDMNTRIDREIAFFLMKVRIRREPQQA